LAEIKKLVGTLEVEVDLCAGCRLCEIACSLNKEGTVFPAASRIRVFQFHPGLIEVPSVCYRCGDYPCVASCPPKVKAMTVDPETGIIKVDPEKCLGIKCGIRNCAGNCRQKTAITFHPEKNYAMVCDLCGGDPSCVKVCPVQAIRYIPGSTHDGMHNAQPPEVIAREFAVGLFGGQDVIK